MSVNFYSVEEFLNTTNYNSYGENVRVILEKLIQNANSEGIDFVIKIGKGKNQIINFSNITKPSVNLCSVYIHKEHIRVKYADGNEVKVSDPGEIPGDGDIIFDLLDRYHEVNRGKRQQSIYVYSDIMDKIEAIAKKDRRNANEIIEQFLDEKTAGFFIDVRHKAEFRNLMRQADMFRNNLDYAEQLTFKLIAFIYLIAAYQGDYKLSEGEKFVMNNKILEDMKGPKHLFDDWGSSKDSEIILGFAQFILWGKQPNKGGLQEILELFGESLKELPFKLAMNSLKILTKKYIINIESENIIVRSHKIITEIGALG